MLSYLLKIFALLLFSFFILFNYYFVFGGHISNFDGYIPYFFVIGIIYSIYKYFQIDSSGEKAIISLNRILLFFLLNLFILCSYYFYLIDYGNIFLNGINLFFSVIYYSILPVLLFFLFTAFGKKVLSKIKDKDSFGKSIFWLLELTIGFIIFITILVILGVLGFYNIISVFLIIIGFIIYSYKEIFYLFKKIGEINFEFDIKEGNYLKFLSTEFFTLVSFIIFGIGLILIIRPTPIGWDDLGVYMNYPHLMAESGNILSLGAMYSWQVFTGIGYMFGSPVYAFYLNITGLFLSFLSLFLVFSNIIKSSDLNKKLFLNLPIILSTLFISLPMVGFQTTKDLKVDEGFFFISVIGLYFLFKYFSLLKEGKNISIIYIFLIGIISGFLFSIKFTALIFIVGVVGVLSFVRIGIYGFIGYLSLFFGLFTIADLWRMMNVLVNPNSIPGFETKFGFISILIGLTFLIFSFIRNKNFGKLYIKELLLFLLGIFLILTPWLGKNYAETKSFNISSLIGGKSEDFILDYSKIYSNEEISKIKNANSIDRKKENSITTNEDLLRYFGYEKGINDFVYMPWNLTMQVNQKGEYTDIGFLFLAFIPLIFIFLPYRNKYYALFFVFLSLIQVLFYLEGSKKVIYNEEYFSVSSSSIISVFDKNDSVFSNIKKPDNIYHINIENYIDDETIYSALNKEEIDLKTKDYISNLALTKSNSEAKSTNQQLEKLYDKNLSIFSKDYEKYYNQILQKDFIELKEIIYKNFYLELKEKVLDPTIGKNFTFFTTPLSEEDFSYLGNLNSIYNSTSFFSIGDIVTLNETLIKNNANEKEIELINNIWAENRSIKGKIIDFFAKINLPYGYAFIFGFFLIPTIFLLLTLKNSKIIYIFKLNLIFASVYTFLWLISAFGIVWYGITMYFSFLLMIGISAFFIVSYKENLDTNKFYFKVLGTSGFLMVIMIYFFNSIFPYIFTNLKFAGNQEFKVGKINQAEAIYLYNDDYKNILFNLNIDKSKQEEFLSEYIDPLLYDQIIKISKLDIYTIIDLLNKFEEQESTKIIAAKSLNNLYKNISNPPEYFRNKEKIYRIGTFLKYYISENNNRLFEDSLLFSFSDYIYDNDSNITIERFKKLGLKYILVDLNAPTIDKSDSHDLTNRYEQLLKSFTNNGFKLIETDSICLRVALENYSKNGDLNQYMTFAGINYESYDENNNVIYRHEKKNSCVSFINKLLDEGSIDDKNYSFLLPYKYYFEKNEKSLDKINSFLSLPYKALFEIK